MSIQVYVTEYALREGGWGERGEAASGKGGERGEAASGKGV